MATVYQLAKALVQQHGFVYDVAFLSVWYSRHEEIPTATLHQVVARMAQVRNVPRVSAAEAEEMLQAYHQVGE